MERERKRGREEEELKLGIASRSPQKEIQTATVSFVFLYGSISLICSLILIKFCYIYSAICFVSAIFIYGYIQYCVHKIGLPYVSPVVQRPE